MKNCVKPKPLGFKDHIRDLESSLQYFKEYLEVAIEATKACEAADSNTTDSTTVRTYVDFETPIENVCKDDGTVNFLKEIHVYTVGDALATVRSHKARSLRSTHTKCAEQVIRELTQNGFSFDNKAFLEYLEKYYDMRLEKYLEKFLKKMKSNR